MATTAVGVLLVGVLHLTSQGDRELPFRRCSQNCRRLCNGVVDPPTLQWCEDVGVAPAQHSTAPWDTLLWSCHSECEYRCMWWAEGERASAGNPSVQYYGKWPFIRLFGVQEPLSVGLSAANLVVHARGLSEYRRRVPPTTSGSVGYPVRSLWVLHGATMVVAWLCAMVFHTRDTYLTEKLDYFSATAGIMMAPLVSILRMLPHGTPAAVSGGIAVAFVVGYIRYVYVMMSLRQFDYGFHGRYNAVWVVLMVPLWCGWWAWSRATHPHAWKAALFAVAVPICAAAELFEFPPIAAALDAHAVWHALTVPLAGLWWAFLTDDAVFETSRPHRDPRRKRAEHTS
jgi:hypothetical protein